MHRNSWPIRQEILGQYLMLMPWNTCSTLGNSLAWIYFSGWTCPQDISLLVASFAMVVPAQPEILKPPKPWVWDAFCKSFHLGFVVSCLTRVLNKVENSPPLTPPISAAYSKQGAASMRAPAQWWGGAMCTLRLETPIIATANPAPSDVDKCARLSLGPNYCAAPAKLPVWKLNLGRLPMFWTKTL